ncbi:MAG: hypothetical protein M3441_15400 [Chloroflexota bacterium]|nr:hypothetical protein [Chloroflexota bacterium]
MDNSTTDSGNSGATSQGSTSGNSGASARYGWLDDYQSGNYDNLPHEEIYSGYRDWSRSANPDELYEGTYHGYQGLQEDQLRGVAADLYSYTQEQGLDLSDLELTNTDYQQWSAQDLARVTGRAYGYSGTQEQDQPEKKEEDKESGGIPKPLIGLALAGALAFAASRVVGGKSDKEDNEDKEDRESTSYQASAQSAVTITDYSVDTAQDHIGSASIRTASEYGTSTASDFGADITFDETTGVVTDQSTGLTSDYSDR